MAEQPTFRSDFTVELVGTSVTAWHEGDAGETGDHAVLRAMLVSTGKDDSVSEMDPDAMQGRINFLVKNRHGTPFEHNSLIFRSEAPIFVYREWHRHRIGVSINEMSGRYTELPGVFYVPPPERPLVQVGKVGHYTYVPGTDDDYDEMVDEIHSVCRAAYRSYQAMLRGGIAKEVARMVLPVNIYSGMYWTCNARSLMAFLSLRTRAEPYWQEIDPEESVEVNGPGFFSRNPGGAMFPSGPMWEIEASARAMEQVFATLFPMTHKAFNEFGRVCP